MPALARWGVWDTSRVSPSGEWQHNPTQHYWSTRTGGQPLGDCSAAEAVPQHPNSAYRSITAVSWASLLHQGSMLSDELVFSELSVILVIFFCSFVFLLEERLKERELYLIPFELSWWSLTLFFYVLLSSYRCFFIWTYRAKAICSVPPFKVSAKPPGMDLDHVFVCDVTVGCSGNDYSVSQRKHFVFIHWADSRNILVLQNKTQRFCFVQMFSIITTNQGKKKIEKIAGKHYMSFLSMQVLKYMMHIVYLSPW